jgi:hypothetical protein
LLVKLNDDGTNDYYVYEHDVLAERITGVYANYMNIPKRDGSRRRDVDFRWFDLKYFTDDDHTGKTTGRFLAFKQDSLSS